MFLLVQCNKSVPSQRRLTADYARGSLTMPAKRVILTVLSKIVKTKGRLRLKLMNWPGPLRVATRPVAAEATVPCSSTRTLAWGDKGLVFRYSLGILYLGILYLGILYLGILYLGILYLGILYLGILGSGNSRARGMNLVFVTLGSHINPLLPSVPYMAR